MLCPFQKAINQKYSRQNDEYGHTGQIHKIVNN